MSFTNGFPSRLAYRVLPHPASSSQSVIVLIPEMNFTCNGSIVGYTVAGLGSIMESHEIQIWREISHSHQYNKTTASSRKIRDDVCTGGLQKIHSNDILHCNLTTGISVRSGDILGLELPHNSRLAFAAATKAPNNYVFSEGVNSASVESISSHQLLPQITLEIESGIWLILPKEYYYIIYYIANLISLCTYNNIASMIAILNTIYHYYAGVMHV